MVTGARIYESMCLGFEYPEVIESLERLLLGNPGLHIRFVRFSTIDVNIVQKQCGQAL